MAIKIDPNNAKAWYQIGLSCKHLQQWEKSVKCLEKAWQLCEKKSNSKILQQEIFMELKRTKKHVFHFQQQMILQQHCLLKQQLGKILLVENTNTVKRLVENKQQDWSKGEDVYAYIEQLTQVYERYFHLETIRKKEENKAQASIPEYFTCPVSMDIMLDPVMTPNGVSYERTCIEEHIQKNGPVDPLTRQKLTLDMLRPNHGLKAAIHDFLNQNPWAFEA